MSADPLGSVDSCGLFNYVAGDPINLRDPWGLKTAKAETTGVTARISKGASDFWNSLKKALSSDGEAAAQAGPDFASPNTGSEGAAQDAMSSGGGYSGGRTIGGAFSRLGKRAEKAWDWVASSWVGDVVGGTLGAIGGAIDWVFTAGGNYGGGKIADYAESAQQGQVDRFAANKIDLTTAEPGRQRQQAKDAVKGGLENMAMVFGVRGGQLKNLRTVGTTSTRLLGPAKWRPGRFASQKHLDGHFLKHAREWGVGNITRTGYLKRAQNLLRKDTTDIILGKTRSNGDVLRYNLKTNEFAIGGSDGTIRTLFKPDPAKHGFATNLDYFLAQ